MSCCLRWCWPGSSATRSGWRSIAKRYSPPASTSSGTPALRTPGTGKTHTTRYLIGQLSGYTRLVLTGRGLHAIGSASALARDLQPAVLVLEDVDLVAEDRSFGPGSTPVLFELLDAMDGAAPDADLLFVLTTNRADLLEPALAARPGRVDVAIEIDLPDADARQRLLALYSRSIPLRLTEAETAEIVERTDGVTASFIKELLRRAMLESVHADPPAAAVTAEHTSRALDDLLDTGQQLTRSLLGVGNDPENLPAGGGLGSLRLPAADRATDERSATNASTDSPTHSRNAAGAFRFSIGS